MKKIYSTPESIVTEIFVEGMIAASVPMSNGDVKGDAGSNHMRGSNPIWDN